MLCEKLQREGRVETPLGVFRIKNRPKPKHVERFGHIVTLNRFRRVVFKQSSELTAALRLPDPKGVPMPQSNVPDQLVCEECGSLVFNEAEFREYLRDWSSATPGADLRPISPDPIHTLVCLCGNPILPGRLRGYGNQRFVARFRKSFAKATEYRERLRATNAKLDKRYASKEQEKRLEERVAKLEQIVDCSKKPR